MTDQRDFAAEKSSAEIDLLTDCSQSKTLSSLPYQK